MSGSGLDDDLFASLGGSLMKDLLSDLAGSGDDDEGGWLSLEQLEEELRRLDDPTSTPVTSSFSEVGADLSGGGGTATAAGFLFQRQQQYLPQQQQLPVPGIAPANGDGIDAWSLSLQKFTASSLEEDFLLADSQRKQERQQKQQSGAAAVSEGSGPPPGLSGTLVDFKDAEEYDTTEAPRLQLPTVPPPGLLPTVKENSATVVSEAALKLERDSLLDEDQQEFHIPEVPHPHPLPRTPQNSVILDNVGVSPVPENVPVVVQPPPSVPPTPPSMPPPPHLAAAHAYVPSHPHPVVSRNMAAVVPMAVPVALPAGPPPSAWGHPPQGAPVVGLPPPPRKMLFCDPHYNAPPIPASIIPSRFMKQRDITYVVHGILKSILISQQKEHYNPNDQYDIQYYQKHIIGVPAAPQSTNKNTKSNTKGKKDDDEKKTPVSELESRHMKAKEWSQTHSVLGHTIKTDVSRPRALIAVASTKDTSKSDNDDETTDRVAEERKQRAALWKSRIYVDQAYQAFSNVIAAWRAVPIPGQIPSAASVQPHLLKLFKCIGISGSASTTPPTSGEGITTKYTVDLTVLQLLLKLPKGKVLLARVLEQALLPPTVLPVLIPAVLEVMLTSGNAEPTPQGFDGVGGIMITPDDRLFVILARLIATLPDLTGTSILKCCTVIQQNSNAALSSTSRMQCTHAFLRRGGLLAASITADNGTAPENISVEAQAYLKEWNETEQAFIKLLSGM